MEFLFTCFVTVKLRCSLSNLWVVFPLIELKRPLNSMSATTNAVVESVMNVQTAAVVCCMSGNLKGFELLVASLEPIDATFFDGFRKEWEFIISPLRTYCKWNNEFSFSKSIKNEAQNSQCRKINGKSGNGGRIFAK